MARNLTVGRLRHTLILCLRHVTTVITVKTHSPVTWRYKMPFFEEVREIGNFRVTTYLRNFWQLSGDVKNISKCLLMSYPLNLNLWIYKCNSQCDLSKKYNQSAHFSCMSVLSKFWQLPAVKCKKHITKVSQMSNFGLY